MISVNILCRIASRSAQRAPRNAPAISDAGLRVFVLHAFNIHYENYPFYDYDTTSFMFFL